MEEPQITNVENKTSEVKRQNVNEKNLSGVVSLIIIVLLSLALAYYVLKDNGVNVLSYVGVDDNEEAETDDTNSQCEIATCTKTLENSGWSKFSVPDYDFSIEIPSYTVNQEGNTPSKLWKVWYSKTAVVSYLSSTYEGTIYAYFYPDSDSIASGSVSSCDSLCLKQHYLYVNIYENTNSSSLDSVISEYRGKWESEYVDGSGDMTSDNLSGEITTKWNSDVWSFSATTYGGTWDGYLVVKGDYIYDIEYQFSTTPEESYQVAQKVLNSIKFE